MNDDKGARVANKKKWRIHTDGRTATTSTTNKQTAQQSEIPPLTLAQIRRDTRHKHKNRR